MEELNEYPFLYVCIISATELLNGVLFHHIFSQIHWVLN